MNNPKSPQNPPPPPEKKTIVEEGTELRGSITATCPIVVQGSVQGEIAGPSVEIRAGGRVTGKMTTGTLSSSGHIAGEVDVEVARLAGEVAPKTVIRATTLDVRLTHPTAKIELRFGTGGNGRPLS
jgi:cytoskeletal protein CcmA (bactofilin family)